MVAISGWMIDPVVCSGMTMGTARVDLAALIELNRLVSGGAKAALFRGEHRITQEEDDEIPQHAGAGVGPAARIRHLIFLLGNLVPPIGIELVRHRRNPDQETENHRSISVAG
ncbi:hypothetical protein ACDY97_05920 [Rhizobium mongolense]|uniref:hypothetical protein n=1 Tax=Rhizobium mongolense TaxID=57676 RepID=UPI003556ADF1